MNQFCFWIIILHLFSLLKTKRLIILLSVHKNTPLVSFCEPSPTAHKNIPLVCFCEQQRVCLKKWFDFPKVDQWCVFGKCSQKYSSGWFLWIKPYMMLSLANSIVVKNQTNVLTLKRHLIMQLVVFQKQKKGLQSLKKKLAFLQSILHLQQILLTSWRSTDLTIYPGDFLICWFDTSWAHEPIE